MAIVPKPNMAIDVVPRAYRPLLGGVKSLFGDEKYSDLTMKCGAREWNVHKAIICSQSEVLDNAFTGEMKEAKEDAYTFKEVEPEAVHAMLEFFYTADYDDMSAKLTGSAMTLNILVFHLASNYLLKPLKTLAADKFDAIVDVEWRSPEFASAIEQVYRLNPNDRDDLKDSLISTTRKHASRLLGHPKDYGDFHDVIRATPCFLAEVFTEHMDLEKPAVKMKWFKCPSCASHDWSEEVTFGVPASISDAEEISCPLGCCTEVVSWWTSNYEAQI